jgi:hypothetical protein
VNGGGEERNTYAVGPLGQRSDLDTGVILIFNILIFYSSDDG